MTITIGRGPLRLGGGMVIGQQGVQLAGGGGVSYDAEAVTLFAAMSSEPDSTRKTLISDTIVALKAAGIWAKLDWMVMLAAHDSQAALLNWITPGTRNAVAVNAPTFTADRGYAGNGTTSYLDTQFVPSTHGVNYALNDASFGVYSRTNTASDTDDMSAQIVGAPTHLSIIEAKAVDGKIYTNINASTADSATMSSGAGLSVSRRTASNAVQIYKNGVSVATGTTASTQRPSVSFAIGARNRTSGGAILFSARQYAMAFAGASMTAQQQLDLFTIVEAYLDAIGAGVI